MSTAAPLTAYRVHRSDGSSYVTNMAAGVTLEQARAYFVGSWQWDDIAETKGARVINVTDARLDGLPAITAGMKLEVRYRDIEDRATRCSTRSVMLIARDGTEVATLANDEVLAVATLMYEADADRTEWHAEQAQFHADKNAMMEARS